MSARVTCSVRHRTLACLVAVGVTASLTTVTQSTAAATARSPARTPVAVGSGGAVSSVDPEATAIGLEVLRRGGNATDAAVATAAALGVTEPYSAGIGGGGFFVHYDAKTGEVETIDGRETAPKAMPREAFLDPTTGEPYPLFPDMVTSGAAVGVPERPPPGTPPCANGARTRCPRRSARRSTWPAADSWWTRSSVNRRSTTPNVSRRSPRPPRCSLPGGDAPEVGAVFRNPDLARTYAELGHRGVDWFYTGSVADEIVETVRNPPLSGKTELPVPPGHMTAEDLAAYEVS